MPAQQKILEEIQSFDNTLSSDEKDMIRKIESESKIRCPALRKKGQLFYYCGMSFPEEKDGVSFNSVYQRHRDTTKLQLLCMGNYGECCCFLENLRF